MALSQISSSLCAHASACTFRADIRTSASTRAPESAQSPVHTSPRPEFLYAPISIPFKQVFFIDGAAHIRVGFNVETDASVAGQAAALEALRDLGAPEGNSDSDSGGGGGWGGGGGGKGEGRRGGPQNCAPEATSGGVADLIPRLGEQEGFGATRDGALFKVGLGLGGAPVVLGSRAARRLQFAERTVALTPSGLVSGPGSDQGRLARVSGRVAQLTHSLWKRSPNCEARIHCQICTTLLISLSPCPALVRIIVLYSGGGGVRRERPRVRSRALRGTFRKRAVPRARVRGPPGPGPEPVRGRGPLSGPVPRL